MQCLVSLTRTPGFNRKMLIRVDSLGPFIPVKCLLASMGVDIFFSMIFSYFLGITITPLDTLTVGCDVCKPLNTLSGRRECRALSKTVCPKRPWLQLHEQQPGRIWQTRQRVLNIKYDPLGIQNAQLGRHTTKDRFGGARLSASPIQIPVSIELPGQSGAGLPKSLKCSC